MSVRTTFREKKGKSGACAIMLKLGFHEGFVSPVMRCVTSVSFSIKVNGAVLSVFRPTRGIRQGDPISPYLFLLCAEGLSSLLKSIGPVHLSRGVRVGLHAPWISHLFFADDSIVFPEASQRGAARIREILDTYSKGSGQLVNWDKSAVFFSNNCPDPIKELVRNEISGAAYSVGTFYG